MNTPTTEQKIAALTEAMGWKPHRDCVAWWVDSEGRTVARNWNPATSHDDCQLLIEWLLTQEWCSGMSICHWRTKTTAFIYSTKREIAGSYTSAEPCDAKFNACCRACVSAGVITETPKGETDAD